MRLLQLTIQSLGVFRDYHHFDFTPVRTPDGQHRPLTVVTGPNGVGKSTLFQAVRVGLYGQLALGDRVSRQAYNDFMLTRLHRHHANGEAVICDRASVALTLQYFESGKEQHLSVERSWERKGSGVFEAGLRVLRDGETPDISASDYQSLVNDLIPPGVGSICFFDAEQMDALSSPEQMNTALAGAFQRLFGVDVVERLIADLDRFAYVHGAGERTKARMKAALAKLRPQIDNLDVQAAGLRAQADSLWARRFEIEAQLAEEVRRLTEAEGSNATSKPVLEAKRAALQQEITKVADQLRETCGELLPFALAPELCRSLKRRLDEEVERRRYQAADALWFERVARVETMLKSDNLWKGLKVSAKNRDIITQRLLRQLQGLYKAERRVESTFVHHVSEPEGERLQSWISQVLHVVPVQVQSLGDQLRKLQDEQREMETRIKRAPTQNLAGEINAEIARLEALIAELGEKHTDLTRQIAVLQYKREEAQRKLNDATEQLRKHREHELAVKSKRALRMYKDALTNSQITAIEHALVACFNRLCRKEHLLGSMRIDPLSFNIELLGPDGRSLTVTSFSAGERHLFALALLWALRQVAGRQLPLVIDTPLARLDDVHRHRLIHDYVPAVSDQVLFLATDTELDDGLLADVEDQLARIYRLRYDEQSEETVVTTDDFRVTRARRLVTLARKG
ncbi:MAG: DNA sulfur modification protein DndD [Blastocatellia bacterium AA13]|nr:MAG: DNA sulfur modification protein DndD [Blastocatellia bacterium AA13]